MKLEPKRDARRLAVVIGAALIMAININTFVSTGGLYPGGATGLALLLQRIFLRFLHLHIPYAAINIAVNAVPVFIGFRFIGRKFTLFSLIMILANSFFVDLLPTYALTYDILLISIFGGLINGLCISMCLIVDATSGGPDVISIYLSQKTGMDSFNVILAFNVALLVAAGALFGLDKALYSIIFQFVSTQVLHLVYRNYQQVTLFVVSRDPRQICETIYAICKHGATIMDGEGSYGHHSVPIVYSVIDAADSRKVIKAIRKLDPDAFINCIRTQELKGRFHYDPKD